MQEVSYIWIVKKDNKVVLNSITSKKFPEITSDNADEFCFLSKDDSILVDLKNKIIYINGKKQEFDIPSNEGIFNILVIKKVQGVAPQNTYLPLSESVVSYRIVINYKNLSSSVGRIYEVLPVQCTGDRILQLCNTTEVTWFLEFDDHKKLFIKLPSEKELKYIR
jgi:hypothetical protein